MKSEEVLELQDKKLLEEKKIVEIKEPPNIRRQFSSIGCINRCFYFLDCEHITCDQTLFYAFLTIVGFIALTLILPFIFVGEGMSYREGLSNSVVIVLFILPVFTLSMVLYRKIKSPRIESGVPIVYQYNYGCNFHLALNDKNSFWAESKWIILHTFIIYVFLSVVLILCLYTNLFYAKDPENKKYLAPAMFIGIILIGVLTLGVICIIALLVNFVRCSRDMCVRWSNTRHQIQGLSVLQTEDTNQQVNNVDTVV